MPGTDFDQFRSLSQLSAAVANILAVLGNMSDTFKLWLGAEAHLGQLFTNIQGVFRHDEWINNEYLGLNTYFAGHSFLEILELFEQSLQMGYLTAAMLLQKLKESYDAAEQVGYVSMYSGNQSQQVSLKLIIDFGEQTVVQYRNFEGELRRATSIKPSTDGSYGKKINEYVEGLRNGAAASGLDYTRGAASRRSMFY